MNVKTLSAAVAVLGAIALPAQAQQSPSSPSSPPQTQRIEVPSSGLTFTFGEIDRNRDNNISVEEWNAFVASLRSRTASSDAGARSGSAAGGGSTRAPEARPLTPTPR